MVSVIIPTYNASKFISETVESVFDQSFQNFEIICVDDGSTDNTVSILDELSQKDPRLKVFTQSHGGVSRSRNLAISKSKGEFIALLDHDDWWYPEKLEKQIPLFNNPNIGVVFSDAIHWLNGEKDICNVFNVSKPFRGCVIGELLKRNFATCQTLVFRKSVLEKLEYIFNPVMKMAEEYDLLLRLSLVTEFDFINEPLSKWRVHEHSYTFEHEEKSVEEMLITSDFFQKHHSNIIKEYSKEFSIFKKNISFCQAMFDWKQGEHIKPFFLFLSLTGFNWKCFFVSFFSLFFSYKRYLKFRYGFNSKV